LGLRHRYRHHEYGLPSPLWSSTREVHRADHGEPRPIQLRLLEFPSVPYINGTRAKMARFSIATYLLLFSNFPDTCETLWKPLQFAFYFGLTTERYSTYQWKRIRLINKFNRHQWYSCVIAHLICRLVYVEPKPASVQLWEDQFINKLYTAPGSQWTFIVPIIGKYIPMHNSNSRNARKLEKGDPRSSTAALDTSNTGSYGP